MKPTFQPVRPNILPAEPILTVRSRMPGRAMSGVWARPSNTTCSQTSSQRAIRFRSTQIPASSPRSSALATVPAGLCGLFSTTMRVRSVSAASIITRSNRQCGGDSRTSFGTPPARRISGR